MNPPEQIFNSVPNIFKISSGFLNNFFLKLFEVSIFISSSEKLPRKFHKVSIKCFFLSLRFLHNFFRFSLKLFQKKFLKFLRNINNINFEITLIFPSNVSIIFLVFKFSSPSLIKFYFIKIKNFYKLILNVSKKFF